MSPRQGVTARRPSIPKTSGWGRMQRKYLRKVRRLKVRLQNFLRIRRSCSLRFCSPQVRNAQNVSVQQHPASRSLTRFFLQFIPQHSEDLRIIDITVECRSSTATAKSDHVCSSIEPQLRVKCPLPQFFSERFFGRPLCGLPVREVFCVAK